ncbi:MAG: hypothetical protein Q4C13_07645 [Clostridia bacterium]|nr:hypothetical protein [Clostridia bacterium]
MSKLNGKWNLVVHTYMGDMRSLLEIAVEDGKLRGQCTDSSNGATAVLEDGVAEGDKFSYSITIKTAVGEMTNKLSGELVGDELRGKSANAMGEFDFDATRA